MTGVQTCALPISFGASKEVTRGQVAMFLWRYAGQPEPESSAQTFSDVTTDYSYYKAIQWAYEQGITKGYSGDREGQFGPYDTCTRGQGATFISRLDALGV